MNALHPWADSRSHNDPSCASVHRATGIAGERRIGDHEFLALANEFSTSRT